VRELLPGIFTWPWFSERHGYDFNGTFVRHPGGNLCIDPVEPGNEVLERLVKEGVARILLTNRNHVRAANRVREHTGAKVAIHPADAAYAREQGASIDLELREGERVGPFEIVGVPGKSPGEVALFEGVPLLAGGHDRLAEVVAGFPPG
jgi:glyoxylase-like metal-dependent hydrolase (beta-lactamase superfamily II)